MKKSITIILSLLLIIALVLPASALSSIQVKAIKLDKSKITLQVGKIYKLNATLTPANTTQKKLTYVTGSEKIATVDGVGNIKGVSTGTTVITVYTLNKKILAKCSVTVSKPEIVKLSIIHDAQWDVDLMASEEFKVWNKMANKAGFDLNFIVVPHANYAQKVEVVFASGDVPDLLWDDKILERQSSGYIIPLNKYLESSGYKDLAGLIRKDVWPFVTISGKIWAYPVPANDAGFRGDMIRSDWLANLGLKVPETINDLASVLHAFTYNDPDQNGKADTYGAVFRQDFSWFDGVLGSFGLQSFLWPAYDLPCNDVKGKLVCQYTTKNYLDYLAYFRKLWADGVFEPNSFLNTGAQWNTAWQTGKVGYIHHYSIRAHTQFTPVTQEVSGNSKAQWDAVTTGIKGPYGRGSTISVAMTRALFITTKCKNPDAAMRYIQWTFMPTDEQKKFLEYGIEGKHYVVVDGKKYRNPNGWIGTTNEYAQLGSSDLFPQNVKPSLSALPGGFTYSGKFTDDLNWENAVFGVYGKSVMKSNLETCIPLNTLLLGKPALPEEAVVPDLKAKILEHTIKIIMGTEELQAGWTKLQNDLENAGLDKMMAARQSWYDKNKK